MIGRIQGLKVCCTVISCTISAYRQLIFFHNTLKEMCPNIIFKPIQVATKDGKYLEVLSIDYVLMDLLDGNIIDKIHEIQGESIFVYEKVNHQVYEFKFLLS